MCTVTYIPSRNKIFITSNRDEKLLRPDALVPAYYPHNGSTLVYPADAKSGGTWIAAKDNGDAAVLLNGAFVRHDAGKNYSKSRGLIFLDILTAEKPSYYFSRTELNNIEPFTLILFEANCLFELRWDGEKKYARQLNAARPHIWSSATLYDGYTAKKREYWFASFLNKHPVPTQQDILNFHLTGGDGDSFDDLFMKRGNEYCTVSTTGILLCEGRAGMIYHDHKNNRITEKKIELTGIIQAA